MAEPTILDTIVARRRDDVAKAKALWPAEVLSAALPQAPPAIDFAARLRRDSPMAIIAEVKRASPSKGDIAPDMDAVAQAMKYAHGGAAGISVLTEPTWFKGSLEDMAGVRAAVEALGEARPAILRKDFIFDEYQVLEARVSGADSVLLIVASLDDTELADLLACARKLGMEPLVEVNNAEEMKRALAGGATVIGINNRDLRSFNVDLGTTDRLAGMVSDGVLLAALSGIATREDVERFQAAGAGAVLVGESLMLAEDPAAKIRALRGDPALTPNTSPDAAGRGEQGGRAMSLVLVQMHGHPGSGKSALARELGRALPAVVIDKDVISSALLRSGVAREDAGRLSYQVMYAQAARFLRDGHSVVFDSPCFWPMIEQQTRRIAAAASASWCMVETQCPDEVRDTRLATRDRLESNPATRDLGPMQPGMYHPECERLVLDTSQSLGEVVALAEQYVMALTPRVGILPLPSPSSRERGSEAVVR